jgi:hypothetical protein
MGQCASKPNEEKSCEVGVGGSSTVGSEQAEEEEEEMSPEELKSRRQMVERRKDSLQVQINLSEIVNADFFYRNFKLGNATLESNQETLTKSVIIVYQLGPVE